MSDKLVEFIPIVSNPHPLCYATKLSSGIDLRAWFKNPHGSVTLYPNQILAIDTGYKVKINPEYEGQVRGRSGLAMNHGVIVLNSPGTVDADFEGPLKVILFNVTSEPFMIMQGDRIAQFVLSPVKREEAYITEATIERGEKGYGSTGIK